MFNGFAFGLSCGERVARATVNLKRDGAMVIVTQKISLVTKLDFLVIFFPFWSVLHLLITLEPVELQKTTAPIFGVAHGVLFICQDKIDLRSP